MSNNFDTAFAAAQTLFATLENNSSVNIDFVMTFVNGHNNQASYAAGKLTYSAAGGTLIRPTPASFTGSVTQLFSNDVGSDSGPFDPGKGDQMSVTVSAPGRPVILHETTTYEIAITFNAGRNDPIQATLAPTFDATSGLAFAAITALANSPLATFSLADPAVAQAPPK